MKKNQIIQAVCAVIVLALLVITVIFAKSVKDKVAQSGLSAQELYAQINETSRDSLPGAQAIQRARELLEEGDYTQAREKLLFIINFYSDAPFAKTARRILGDMNLDQLLSPQSAKEKEIYTIQPGDSLSKIGNRTGSTVEYLMALNGLLYANRIHPGQELLVREMKFETVINVPKKTLTLLRKGQFVKDYPLKDVLISSRQKRFTTKVQKVLGYDENATYPRSSSSYHMKKKIVILNDGNLQVRGVKHPDEREPGAGFFLLDSDMEEYALLVKSGYPIEIQL